ncbi:hypothetical protein [Flintibacter sp. KGMB00164]|uniref:hypothetical protein n=1 Tax=Flintibacter sp. KGMB00164 TaxID=2610895 RepID=UPI001244C4C2|nr:hypothetical protein [Flintibacter sp. KGMB00164]
MDRNEREARRHQEDRALNKALIWVGVAIVLEFLLVLVNRYYINYTTSTESINRVLAIQAALVGLRWVSLVALVVCVVWMLVQLSKNGNAVLPGVLAIAAGGLLLCSHVILNFRDAGLRMMFWMVPAWAALALVYYLYQREFFFSAVISGLGLLGLWFVRHASPLGLYTILVVVVLVLLTLGLFLLKKKDGLFQLGKGKARLLPAEANYSLIFLSFVVSLVVIALAAFVGGSMAYYLLYAMVAWLFALLVYYTVKMI